MNPIHILIAEDHGIVRLGTMLLIQEMYATAQVTEAANFRSTLAHLDKKKFDLLILDINIPGGDNVQMIVHIHQRQPGLPILILSSYDEEPYALLYLRAGALGYIQKESHPDEIRNAIQRVLKRDLYTSSAILQQLLQLNKPGSREKQVELSAREKEIMLLLIKGLTPSQIKNQLDIQLSTISTHKARILEKMNVRTVLELADKVRRLEAQNSSSMDHG